MAIKIKSADGYVYFAIKDKVLDNSEKNRADYIYEYSKDKLNKVSPGKDLLSLWLERGKIANNIHQKFLIEPREELFFWQMLYDVTSIKLPERSKNLLARNEFWLGRQLNIHLPPESKWINNWTVWREMFEAKPISVDARVAEWMIQKAVKDKYKNRDNMRVLLKKVRNRLKNLDSSVLNKRELFTKLEEIN